MKSGKKRKNTQKNVFLSPDTSTPENQAEIQDIRAVLGAFTKTLKALKDALVAKVSLYIGGHALLVSQKSDVVEVVVNLAYPVGSSEDIAVLLTHYLVEEGFIQSDSKCKVIVIRRA